MKSHPNRGIKFSSEDFPLLGRGGGLVVSALAYCSEDPSSNPAVYLILVRKDENERKGGRGWPVLLKKRISLIFGHGGVSCFANAEPNSNFGSATFFHLHNSLNVDKPV